MGMPDDTSWESYATKTETTAAQSVIAGTVEQAVAAPIAPVAPVAPPAGAAAPQLAGPSS